MSACENGPSLFCNMEFLCATFTPEPPVKNAVLRSALLEYPYPTLTPEGPPLAAFAQLGPTDPAEQFTLARKYDAKDHPKAAHWYEKAAEQGHPAAQYNLGYCYEVGRGIQKSPAKAAFWYEKAAEQGIASVQNTLGCYYHSGTGVEKDLEKAVYWFKKAAEQGHPAAQHNLGLCYERGEGVKKNLREAAFWYKKAAEQGFKDAAKRLQRLRFRFW